MLTRSKGQPLELFDPEIEASNRRRNAQRRLNQGRSLSPLKREPPTTVAITMADNVENNAPHPDPVVQQLQLQLADLVKQVKEKDEQQVIVPVQNMYAYREVENPPIGNDGIDANHFELKPGLLNMTEANAFGGKANEDPNKHLTKFIQISNTVKLNGGRDEQIRLRLFPFSLRDDARDWYDSMGSGSVRTWDAMVDLFLEKYFPPSEVLKRQAEIIQFQMKPHETIREAWAIFKTLLKRCPKHGLSPGHQVITFYRGCTPEAMCELNWSAGGAILQLGENDAMQVIERVASTDEGWNNERNNSYRVASVIEDDRIDKMSKQLDLLTTQLGIMEMRQSGPELQGGVEDVNYVHQGGNNRNFNNYRSNQGGGTYNQYGNKVHPNLSYGNPNSALQN